MRAPLLAFLRSEPLLHFLIVGASVFLLHSWTKPVFNEEEIFVSAGAVEGLAAARAEIVGRDLTDVERTAAVEDWVDGEVLYREAKRLGLDQRDTSIRRRLVEKMLLSMEEPAPALSKENLRAYYEAHVDEYAPSERISFRHVFFASGHTSDAPDVSTLLRQLKSGEVVDAPGDRFWLGNQLTEQTRESLTVQLGAGFASTVFQLRQGEWFGPVASSRGHHLVLVDSIRRPEPLSFGQLTARIREDYRLEKRRESQRAAIRDIRRRYRILIADNDE